MVCRVEGKLLANVIQEVVAEPETKSEFSDFSLRLLIKGREAVHMNTLAGRRLQV